MIKKWEQFNESEDIYIPEERPESLPLRSKHKKSVHSIYPEDKLDVVGDIKKVVKKLDASWGKNKDSEFDESMEELSLLVRKWDAFIDEKNDPNNLKTHDWRSFNSDSTYRFSKT